MNEDQLIFDPYNKQFHAKHCPLQESQKSMNNCELASQTESPNLT